MSEQEKIRSYRERAEELRTIAQDFMDEITQSMLEKLARDYERMAELIELNRATGAPRTHQPLR